MTRQPASPSSPPLLDADTHATLPCRGGPEWFSSDPRLQRRAAELCMACTKLEVCRAYALAAENKEGFWGGLKPRHSPPQGRTTTEHH
ncbi:WhiB family transcriptional regulator [Arthrobacter cupressi]